MKGMSDVAYSQRIIDPKDLAFTDRVDPDAHYRDLVRDELVRFAQENDCTLGEGVVTRTEVAQGDSDIGVDDDGITGHIGYYRYRASAPMWRT